MGIIKLEIFFEAAVRLKVLKDERKDHKDLLYYIICFNLRNLSTLLSNYYWDNKQIKELGKELQQINLESIYKDCKTVQNRSILEWVHEKKFFNDAFLAMHENVKTITDHFYGQHSGYNDNTQFLMERYLSIDAFLNQNSIIYDIYSEFCSLTDLFIEGLVASYGCNPFLGGKLNYFNDLLIQKLMISGKAEVLRKHFNRYQLKEAEYSQTASTGNSFIDAVENILENYPSIIRNYNPNSSNSNRYFWDNYSEIIYNVLVLLATIKFEDLVVERVAEKFLIFLEQEKYLHHFQLLKNLRFFLHEKQKQLSPDILKKYFVLALKEKAFHTDAYFETLHEILADRHIEISLGVIDFEFVKAGFLVNPESDASVTSWFSIGYIFSLIADNKQKVQIKTFVADVLVREFDSDKYYLANMFDIIPNEEDFTNQYFDRIEKLILKGPQKRMFESKDYYTDSRVDNFLNFCYKNNLEVSETIRKGLQALGVYYTWLIDMDSFNYSEFNTEWLYAHFTIFFKKRFRQCKSLKEHLLNVIKNDPKEKIERIFIMIYCYND